MFTKNSVSQSMIDAVQSVLAEDKKLLLEPEDEKKDRKKNDEVKEELKGNQDKLDKNHNGKLDKQDFKLLRMKKEGVLDAIKSGAKKLMDKVAPGDDKLLSNLEKETGGKRPNMYNKPKNEEVKQIDEISTKTLAAAAGAASDPDSDYVYGKSHDPQKFADHAKKTKDAKSAAAVQGAADAKGHYPRDNHTHGYDKLAYRTPSRVTAAGKANKQDTKALKTKLKEEEVELDEAINDNMHPAGVALLKHIKPEHHNLYKPHLTTDVFNGSFRDRHDVLTAAKQAGHLNEDIGAMQSVVGENKGKKAIRVDTLKGPTVSNDPEVKIANAHFSGKAATLKSEGKGTETPSTFVTDSATHREINKAVRPTFKKIKEMLGKTGTSEEKNEK